MKSSAKIFSSFFILCFLLLSFGCNGAAVDGLGTFVPPPGGPAPVPTSGDGSVPALVGTSNSVSNDGTFYVGIDSKVTPIAHVHLSTGFNNPCVIPISTVGSQNLDCFIEVPEGTLRFNGIKLKINQPAAMCNVIRFTPFWYYNEETGKGPTAINITTNETILASGDKTWAASADCTVANDGGAGVFDNGCKNQSEFKTNYSNIDGSFSIKCEYDKSGVGHNHNCCLGDYVKTVKLVVNNLGAGTITSSTTVTNEKWGGDVKDCIGGQGVGWEGHDPDNYPVPLIFGNPDLDLTKPNYKEIVLKAPVQAMALDGTRYIQSNLSIANYHHPTDHTHTGVVDLVTTSTAPFFVNPVDDRSGSPMTSGYENYIVDCADPAQEIKHRMTLHVREWDSYADFLTYVTTKGATVVPDRHINETIGGLCDGVAGPCDDFFDQDSFLYYNIPGGVYGNTPLTRSRNFPNDVYK